jgi:hypothetical protein
MKKSLCPITVPCALLFLLAVAGCHRSVTTPAPAPTPSLQSQIIGKWTIVTAISTSTYDGSTYLDTIPYTSADYLDFKADSTLSIMAKGVAYNGTWRIDSSKLFIAGTNYVDRSTGYELPILDPHNLQLYYTETGGSDTYLEEKLNLTK